MPKPHSNNRARVAACVFELQADGAGVQLLPAGRFSASDGRPFDAEAWFLDAAIAERVIDRAAARQSAIVIDYEHQTLWTEMNGRPAPAAGWFNALAYREGVGLFAADVAWTERARGMIDADEYRYISAVFTYLADTGEVLEILHAGITNTPALDGLPELAVQAAARFSLNDDNDPEDSTVNEELLKLLGLTAEASEEDVQKAVAALNAKLDEAGRKDETIAALKAAADNPDPSRYVPVKVVEELRGEIAALRKHQTDGEVEAIVTAALAEGRLLPAQEEWARKLGASDIAALRQYVETAEPVAALRGSQTGGKPPEGGDKTALTESQTAICRRLGISEDDYRAAAE